MAYEVFQRTVVRVEEPTLTIKPDGSMTLNAAATRVVVAAGVTAVLLLWDKASGKVALKAVSRRDRNAFFVSLVSGKRAGNIRAKSFLTYIGWKASEPVRMPAIWLGEERTFEVILPAKYWADKR